MNGSTRNSCIRAAALAAVCLLPILASAAPPFAGPNVNMVSGTRFPEGDPFLTKQNEPSMAVSSRNPRHLLAASNDYRQVAVLTAEGQKGGKAWNTLYKSVDGGASWRSVVLGGCPLDILACRDPTGLTAPLRALAPDFSADPTVRPGPYGTFFYSFIAGRRDGSGDGVVAVQRFVDKNNDIQRSTDTRTCTGPGPGCIPLYDPPACESAVPGCTIKAYVRLKQAEDPILPDTLVIVNKGTPGQFIDKPWNAADVPRSWNANKTCKLLAWTGAKASETVPAFNVYVSFANFVGHAASNEHPQVHVAVSNDCGTTFSKQPIKLSSSIKANSGTNIAIDPLTGTVYVVWRNFDGAGAIYMSKSTDGGKTWSKKPVLVANFIAYDQGATGASFRTLAFPTIAVSVKNNQSRVHVAWAQRKASAARDTAPYDCLSANAADCDVRIVMATSTNGGDSWPAPLVFVDGNLADLTKNPANPQGRGHQLQPALTFAAGKLLVTWLDSRLDHTEGVLRCLKPSGCTNVNELEEVREAKGNLAANCSINVTKPEFATLSPTVKADLALCRGPGMASASDAVWTPYITDGTPGLARRHTLDVFAAMADPEFLDFASTRVSQYVFGSTVEGDFIDAAGTLDPRKGTYDIRQKELFPPNLPMFVNGNAAFIGDYIDAAGQLIVATGDQNGPTYKYNVGGNANGSFTTGGLPPVFHVSFTDNRDVIPPLDGNWATPTCLSTALTSAGSTNSSNSCWTRDASGNLVPTGTPKGYAGNRNQNVYSAIVAENSLAVANANSKKLSATTARGFVVTVKNLSDREHTYTLWLPAQAPDVVAAFNKESFAPGTETRRTTLPVVVQPRSSSTRTVWVTSGSNPKAKVLVNVDSAPTDGALSMQLVLNADPGANEAFVTNGDGTDTDLANDDLGNVVLSNAVLTNNVLSNNALTNNVLSNNALTNAVLSNVVLSNAALSNNALTNNVLSNVVLTNAVLSNNALSNAVLSNVVLSNSVLNAALTNLDPANVALSNAVLSNNELANVALTNNALSNAVLSNAVLSNAVLSNVALSNAALSNNALTNNALSNVALSNAPLIDTAAGETEQTAAALLAIETASFEIGSNQFVPADLLSSDFKETSFTIRNQGNTDATLAVKLMLRDAVCTETVLGGITDGTGRYTCTTPGYKLQLVLRKVSFTPSAIAPTGPATGAGRRDLRIGLVQRNTEVSNVGDLPIISPDDPNLGRFLVDDERAATLPLAAGEWAYATIRAIGICDANHVCTTPPDPADLLRWGVKAVATNASNAGSSLIIRTLTFPAAPAFVTLDTATPAFRTLGGTPAITGSAKCSDQEGNLILQGSGPPAPNLGEEGNYYIDTDARWVYGQKDQGGWGAGASQIGSDPQAGPKATVACPPSGIAVNPFPLTGDRNATTLSFTPRFWGEFFMLASVADSTGPEPKDQQVIRAVVLARMPALTFPGFPTQLTFNNNGAGVYLRPFVASDSANSAGVAQQIVLTASGSCEMADADNLRILRATVPVGGAPDCIVTAHQDGNEIYAPRTIQREIYINQAPQATVIDPPPAALTYNNFGAPAATLTAHVESTTAPNSGLAVTFSSQTLGVCATGGTNGAQITIVNAGTCTIAANQAGNDDYAAAPQVTRDITINKADQTLAFDTVPANVTFGNGAQTMTAAVSSLTAPPSTTAPNSLSVALTSQAAPICTVSGTSVTILGAGTCTIAGNQSGNGNYNAATEQTGGFVISRADQEITFAPAALTGVTFGNGPQTVSATSATKPPLSGTAAGPSGIPVVLTSQTPLVCTISGTTVTIVAAGDCTIAANQAGNANYNPAEKTLTFTVAKADQEITFAPAALTGVTFGNGPQTVSATSATKPPLSGTAAGPSGIPVVLTSQTPLVCTISGTTVTIVAAGDCTIAANQAGNANYNPAEKTLTFTIAKAQQAINFAALPDRLLSAGPFTVGATSTSPTAPPSGVAIVFTSQTPAQCTTGGTNGTTVTPVAAGTCTIAADQAGNANYAVAPQVTRSFAITDVTATTTTVVSSHAYPGPTDPGLSAFGEGVTFTATVTGDSPTGTVRFKDGDLTIVGCVAKLLAGGQAQCLINNLPIGQHAAITATYSGDIANLPSSSDPIVQDVAGTGPVTPMLAGGRTHTCALDDRGYAWCWGRNDRGQLGDGTQPTDQQTAVPVFGPFGGDEVTAGAEHACALVGGDVFCWGDNTFGQLGDGTTTSYPAPNPVTDLPPADVVAVSAGFEHSCVLNSGGDVTCWGRNQYGQLGDGTTIQSETPVDVSFGSGMMAIAAGQTHTCALTLAGGVKCWGENGAGQLGNGSNTPSSTPVDVQGLSSGVAAIAANGRFSCALTEAGGVKCWGNNIVGAVGDGTNVNRNTPVDVVGLTSGATALAAGGGHVCALLATGGLKCWGYNGNGQLGDGTQVSSNVPVAVVGLPSGAVTVTGGGDHTCASVLDGSVHCWGFNDRGQVGNNTFVTPQLTPQPVWRPAPPPPGAFTLMPSP